MEAMAEHHTYSIEFKRQVAQEYIAGETLHALAKRHDLPRNLEPPWYGPVCPVVWEGRRREAPPLSRSILKIDLQKSPSKGLKPANSIT
jgi:hypothetical protein